MIRSCTPALLHTWFEFVSANYKLLHVMGTFKVACKIGSQIQNTKCLFHSFNTYYKYIQLQKWREHCLYPPGVQTPLGNLKTRKCCKRVCATRYRNGNMEKACLYVWKYMKGFFKQRQLKTDSWKWIGFYLGDGCGGSPESGDSMCKIDSKENLWRAGMAWLQ